MLSIIVCSRHSFLDPVLVGNIQATVGTEYEIVHIDNSDNQYNICSAYNIGVEKSKFDYMCFIHEDILFHTRNWGEKLISHLNFEKVGVVGVGGSVFLPRVPSPWPTLPLMGINIIQSDKTGRKRTERSLQPADFRDDRREATVLDGVFLAMKKDIFSSIRFDENLSGFHGYDYDICIQAHIAGFRNYVIYDIDIEHFSRGKTTKVFFRNLIQIFKKWESALPLIASDYVDDVKQILPKLEEKKNDQLIKKMVRKGFEVEEIYSTVRYFSAKKKNRLLFSVKVHAMRLVLKPIFLIRCLRESAD